jgi:hypothetical protein
VPFAIIAMTANAILGKQFAPSCGKGSVLSILRLPGGWKPVKSDHECEGKSYRSNSSYFHLCLLIENREKLSSAGGASYMPGHRAISALFLRDMTYL